jgi:uncharacterized membrane protein
MKLGKRALGMMLAGSFGIVFGAPVVFYLFRRQLPPESWSAFGVLSGSWTGGSANMLAAREVLGTSDAVFAPMVAVDVVVAYSWMGILIALAAYQSVYDRWNRSDLGTIAELRRRTEGDAPDSFHGYRLGPVLRMIGIAAAVSLAAIYLASFLPMMAGITETTWTILIVSLAGLSFSFTGLRKLQSYGASKIGYLILYFVLAAMGARANLRDLFSSPVFVLAGFVLVLIHFLFMLVASKFMRVPFSLVATASQANIGGPVSAPIVAVVYEPALAPVGLLLGVFGNVIGTYLALLCAAICHWVAHNL